MLVKKSQFTYPLEQGVSHIPPVSTAAFGSTPFQSNPSLARPGRSLQQSADNQQLEMQAATITGVIQPIKQAGSGRASAFSSKFLALHNVHSQRE